MKIIEVLKIPRYFYIALASMLIFSAVYIYSQVLGIIQNIDLWFAVLPWYNAVFFLTFVVLFGAAIGYQFYLRDQPKVCSASQKRKGAAARSGGMFGIFMVGQCPACASIATLLLPASAVGFLAEIGPIL